MSISSFTIDYNSLRYGQSTRIPRVIQPFSRNVLSDPGKIAVSVALGVTTKALKKHNLRFDDDNDGRGLYPFVRISYANFKDYNGDGYKSVRHGLLQAQKLGIIKLHKPNHFTRTIKIEFVSFTRHFQNAKSHVAKTQTPNITHEYITDSNKSTEHEYSTKHSFPKNFSKSMYANNARYTENELKKAEHKINQHKENYVQRRANHLRYSLGLPKAVTDIMADLSGNDINKLNKIKSLLVNDKTWMYKPKNFKKMFGATLGYNPKVVSDALTFENNKFFTKYHGRSFAGKLSYIFDSADIAVNKHRKPKDTAKDVEIAKWKYVNNSLKYYYQEAVASYTPANEIIAKHDGLDRQPHIPILKSHESNPQTNAQEYELKEMTKPVKLHPTSKSLQRKIQKQLKAMSRN